jgi:hypothetical protein
MRIVAIAAAAQTIRRAEAEQREAVHAARADGIPWNVIAAALGKTPQAARERYATPPAQHTALSEPAPPDVFYAASQHGKIPKHYRIHTFLDCRAGGGGNPNRPPYSLDEINRECGHGPDSEHGVRDLTPQQRAAMPNPDCRVCERRRLAAASRQTAPARPAGKVAGTGDLIHPAGPDFQRSMDETLGRSIT